jgi:hypothetical protein
MNKRILLATIALVFCLVFILTAFAWKDKEASQARNALQPDLRNLSAEEAGKLLEKEWAKRPKENPWENFGSYDHPTEGFSLSFGD